MCKMSRENDTLRRKLEQAERQRDIAVKALERMMENSAGHWSNEMMAAHRALGEIRGW